MTLANDSILVTPGTGATVATHSAGSKEHQLLMLATADGHIYGTVPTWIVYTANQVNVAAARTTHFDLFNASGSGTILTVRAAYIIPTLTAVTGVGLTWEIIRTSAVGTGGTTLTPRPYDTANSPLPAQVTARSKPTGGATTNYILAPVNSSSEETIPVASWAHMINLVQGYSIPELQGWVCREGEGLKVDQTVNSSVGSTNIVMVFTRS
jgi:hypothetical protein